MLNIPRIKRIFRSLFASSIKSDLSTLKQEARETWIVLDTLVNNSYLEYMPLKHLIPNLENHLRQWVEKKYFIEKLKINLRAIDYGQYLRTEEALSYIISSSILTLREIKIINLQKISEAMIREDIKKYILNWMAFLKDVEEK